MRDSLLGSSKFVQIIRNFFTETMNKCDELPLQ